MSQERPHIVISEGGLVKFAEETLRLDHIAKGRQHFGRFLQMANASNVPEVFFNACINVASQVYPQMSGSPWDALDARITNSVEISRRLYGQDFRTRIEAMDALNYGFVMSGIKFLRSNMQRRWAEEKVEQIIKLPVFTVFDALSEATPEDEIERQRRDSIDPAIRTINGLKLVLYEVCGAIVRGEEVVTQSYSIPRKLYNFLRQVFSEKDKAVTLERSTLTRQSVETYFTDPSKTSRMILLARPRGV